jgi:hypothetical protein
MTARTPMAMSLVSMAEYRELLHRGSTEWPLHSSRVDSLRLRRGTS